MIFSEDSRVKTPCILHLVRLGYSYLSLKNAVWDEETNIFPDLFHAAIARINPGIESADIAWYSIGASSLAPLIDYLPIENSLQSGRRASRIEEAVTTVLKRK